MVARGGPPNWGPLARGALSTTIATAVAAVSAMCVAFISAGLLGAADRGRYVAIVTATSLIAIVCCLGVGSAARRMLVDRNEGVSLRQFLEVSTALSTIGACGALVAGLASESLFDVYFSAEMVVSVGVLGMASTLNLLLLEALNSQGRISQAALLAGAAPMVTLLALSVFAMLGLVDLATAVASTMAGTLATTVGCILALRPARAWGSGGTRRSLLRTGLLLAPFSLSQAIAMRIDRVLLPAFGHPEDAGVYSISAALAETLRFGSLAIGQQFVFRAATETVDRCLIFRALKVLLPLQVLGASLLLSALAATYSPLLGAEYADAVTLFVALAFGELFMTVYLVYSRALLGAGSTTALSFGAVVGSIFMIVGDVLLIPSHGAVGAAVASVVAYAVLAGTAVRSHRSWTR